MAATVPCSSFSVSPSPHRPPTCAPSLFPISRRLHHCIGPGRADQRVAVGAGATSSAWRRAIKPERGQPTDRAAELWCRPLIFPVPYLSYHHFSLPLIYWLVTCSSWCSSSFLGIEI
jgi:hypothetical protein